MKLYRVLENVKLGAGDPGLILGHGAISLEKNNQSSILAHRVTNVESLRYYSPWGR